MRKKLHFIAFCAFISVCTLQAQVYHESDKEGLRKFLRQPSAHSGLFNFELVNLSVSDTIDWYDSEDWIDKLYTPVVTQGNRWNSSQPKRLSRLYIGTGSGKSLGGELDCSNFEVLEELIVSYTKITNLDIRNNPLLNHLSCVNNQLTELNISKNPLLTYLACGGNQLAELNISKNPGLTVLNCYGNKLTNIHFSNNLVFDYFSCGDNYLKFSNLFSVNATYRLLDPQRPMFNGEISANEVIDISSEYNIDGSITSYQWVDENNQPVQLSDLGEGKFMAGEQFIGKTLTCKMTNERIPNLTLDYIATITYPYFELTDHFSIVETPTPDYYAALPGQTFRVNAVPSNYIDRASVRIGLFKTTGVFMRDITQSNEGSIFTCCIPDYFSTGNYMLQPFTLDGDQVRILERRFGSNMIDKLPFAVTNTRSYLSNDESTISSHLVLNTSEKNLYKAYIDQNFRVVVNTDITSLTRIGLFDMYGALVEDITQSVAGKIFTCKISYNIFPDNYMIMPFEGTDIRLIERNPGAAVIDKLPLVVDYDWTRSVAFRSEEENTVETTDIVGDIQFYPNPVQDMLYIRTGEPVIGIRIYDMNGRLVKEAAEVDQISFGNLISGTYILKVKTTNKEMTGKVVKK